VASRGGEEGSVKRDLKDQVYMICFSSCECNVNRKDGGVDGDRDDTLGEEKSYSVSS